MNGDDTPVGADLPVWGTEIECPPPMMNFNHQSRYCHAERSEASLCPSRETLRCAQGDKTVPMLLVKVHYRPPANPTACPELFVKPPYRGEFLQRRNT